MDLSDLHPSWPRAASNALWRPLKHAFPDNWPIAPTDWTVNDPTGNPRTGGRNTTPGIAGPVPHLEPVTEVERVIGRIDADDWPGGVRLACRLLKTDHDKALAEYGTQGRYEYSRALRLGTGRVPFTLDRNRHGNRVLRRNPDVNAYITPLVVTILDKLAHVAFVEVITPELDAALVRGEEIRATEVFAIAEKSGVGV